MITREVWNLIEDLSTLDSKYDLSQFEELNIIIDKLMEAKIVANQQPTISNEQVVEVYDFEIATAIKGIDELLKRLDYNDTGMYNLYKYIITQYISQLELEKTSILNEYKLLEITKKRLEYQLDKIREIMDMFEVDSYVEMQSWVYFIKTPNAFYVIDRKLHNYLNEIKEVLNEK